MMVKLSTKKNEKIIVGYKFVTSDLRSKNGNTQWVVGEWQTHGGELKLCVSGFHACLTPRQAFEYVYGDRLFVVEAKGKVLHEKDNKFVAQSMRLTKELPLKTISVAYAIACAWRSLKHFEKAFPKDNRCRQAIVSAEKYLLHSTEKNRLRCETLAEAAWSASQSAALSAEYAARSADRSAEYAAWSAARSAARSAEYAAWSAARSAARSAEYAARSADRSAEYAAWSAARSTEIAWQEKKLLSIVKKHLTISRRKR